MSSSSTRPLDQIEQMLVDQTRSLDGFSHRELTELAHQLRSRRERAQRTIRQRNREARLTGKPSADKSLQEKKAALGEAIERLNLVLDERAANRTGPSASAASKPAKAPAKAQSKTAAAPEAEKAAKPKAAAKAAAKSADKPASKEAPATKKPAAKKT